MIVDKAEISQTGTPSPSVFDQFYGIELTDDLTRGHSVETVTKRHALPPILVQAIKLRDMTDQDKLRELGINHES
ncbi:MAG: hypothetical protein HY912_16055 [Desulfomonile tiedjei]|uniref:Uncharacterized protein n=1 Tax=Desulfomonile tiedjei TaxID=2358 RepID=A0A9D6V354_9BACT|nr:hypothetical protein [Desulfomonile tiedjei]